MTDHNSVPTMANGDWVDGAWLNQYVRDNFAAIFQGLANSGSMAYALDGNTIAELVKPAVDSYLKMKATGDPEYVPIEDVGVPTGVILPFGGDEAHIPAGYLLCDHAEYSRTTYARLFAVIGTAHGEGNGSTTFNVPDGLGRTFIGAGTGSGLTERILGETLGEENHALTAAENGPHDHDIYHRAVSAGQNVDGGVLNVANALNEWGKTASSGSGTAHNTMQPSFVGNWIIKD